MPLQASWYSIRVGNVPHGFTYRAKDDGSVEVFHFNRSATTLRGAAARRFLEDVSTADEDAAQGLMARVTGNYKRGNERTAKNHPRNS